MRLVKRISPTRAAGASIKPGVERSGTPGTMLDKSRAHEVGGRSVAMSYGGSGITCILQGPYAVPAVARFTGSKLMHVETWGSAALHPSKGRGVAALSI